MPAKGDTKQAEWMPYGPALNSYEGDNGALTVDYTDNVDTRWAPSAMLGPAINVVSLASAGGTTADSSGAALSGAMNATLFMYVIRGTKWAKVKVSDMTLISDGSETALAEAATSVLYTKSSAGTEEISFGMDNTAYRVITAVGAGATDTDSANTAGVICKILGDGAEGAQVPQVAGLGRSGAASSAMNTVRKNILSGSITMATPNWLTVDAIGPLDVDFTSFALDLDYWVVGTNRGPYYVDTKRNHFRNLMPEIGRDSNNCKQMTNITYLGTVVPLNRGARQQYGLQSEGGIGPERFRGNTSPVQGRITGVAGNQVWTWLNIYNPVTGETYLCAVQPRQPGAWHGQPLDYYPLATFDNTTSAFLLDIDTANGTRTNPTLVGGHSSNMFYMTQGRIPREPDDSNYRFATSGTLYLTELRRNPWEDKEVEYVEFESAGCSATQTITVSLSVNGGTASQIGGAVTTNGYQRLYAQPGMFRGHRIKPSIAFATGASTASPSIVGKFFVHYRVYDKRVDGVEPR
jgi:hypothetical protein